MLASLTVVWIIVTLYLITTVSMYLNFISKKNEVSIELTSSINTYPELQIRVPSGLHTACVMMYRNGHKSAFTQLQEIKCKMTSLVHRLREEQALGQVSKELDLDARKLWIECENLRNTLKPDWSSILTLYAFIP